MIFTIYIIFLLFLSFYALFIAAVDDVKTFTFICGDDIEEFSNQECPFGKDPEKIETSTDMLNCEKRIWSATDPKGWTCAAPIPKDKLKYDSNANVKYHDTIDDIKAQNPDVPLELTGINYYDVSNNIFQYKKAPAQNNMLFTGPGKYKYGYDSYVPQYHESVVLSKLTDLANKELEENTKKLNEEYNLNTNPDDAYKSKSKTYQRMIELLRKNNINIKYYPNECRDFIINKNRNTYTLHDIVKKEYDEHRKHGIIYANQNTPSDIDDKTPEDYNNQWYNLVGPPKK